MVSGCFDLLHAGHIAFFKTAARYGKVHAYIGQDQNIKMLKGKAPYFSQEERKYMVGAVRYVERSAIASGSGILDFENDMKILRPDIFIVNSDGYTEGKQRLCDENGVELIVLDRIPEEGLPARSSSSSKKDLRFPYRVCLAGGWIDQPWVSEKHPGSVTVAQLWPTVDFNDRSGMATSSRKIAIELWGNKYPEGDPYKNAQLLFGAENPPGSEYVSGTQDHIGLLLPGLTRIDYNGNFWPYSLENSVDPEICEWLSSVLNFVFLKPRPEGYNPTLYKNLNKGTIRRLGQSGRACYDAILKMDVKQLGESMKETILWWKEMLHNALPEWVIKEWQKK